ncbi:MAG TPA: hypothetical protein VGK48_07195 [Terriglobia bacterium]|jgi:hypothetical protein
MSFALEGPSEIVRVHLDPDARHANLRVGKLKLGDELGTTLDAEIENHHGQIKVKIKPAPNQKTGTYNGDIFDNCDRKRGRLTVRVLTKDVAVTVESRPEMRDEETAEFILDLLQMMAKDKDRRNLIFGELQKSAQRDPKKYGHAQSLIEKLHKAFKETESTS